MCRMASYQKTINTHSDILIHVLPKKWREESIESYTKQEVHGYSHHLEKNIKKCYSYSPTDRKERIASKDRILGGSKCNEKATDSAEVECQYSLTVHNNPYS